MTDYKTPFIDFVLAEQVLRFGTFTLKSGRVSPYFFNTGLFQKGAALSRLGAFYAEALLAAALPFDMLFGPAYKGIPLATSVAIALARDHGRDVPYCFNRKEAKDHGEGGDTLGAPLVGRVLIVDDVISSGLSVAQSVDLIRAAGATPAGVVIALDRQERGTGAASAVEEVRQRFGIPVQALITLADLLAYLAGDPAWGAVLPAVAAYRAQYGTTAAATP
jgi:orotate phosphoribosyltransferase